MKNVMECLQLAVEVSKLHDRGLDKRLKALKSLKTVFEDVIKVLKDMMKVFTTMVEVLSCTAEI